MTELNLTSEVNLKTVNTAVLLHATQSTILSQKSCTRDTRVRGAALDRLGHQVPSVFSYNKGTPSQSEGHGTQRTETQGHSESLLSTTLGHRGASHRGTSVFTAMFTCMFTPHMLEARLPGSPRRAEAHRANSWRDVLLCH